MTLLVLLAIPTLTWMLGPGATWVMEHIDHTMVFNDDKDRAAALAAIRGNVLAVATGLAALLAVFYTARNADTARRTFQLGERGHDTDRFSKAVEQLGSSQAPVRLGGLYALEQLAQNNPRLRQTVVDVICAYLRMPWTPPEAENRQQQIRAAQRTARTRSPGRAVAPASRNRDEEKQVRLTAQRLLADHLRWRKRRWWERPAAANPLFWSGIRLDLTGATLLSFDLDKCRVERGDFSGATFANDAWFGDATFTEASFENATFSGNAWFMRATFTAAGFADATFHGYAAFDEATFNEGIWFNRATFIGDAQFDTAIFADVGWFEDATFTGNTVFRGTAGTALELEGARVTRPDGNHVWPSNWRVEVGPDGAVLMPVKQLDGGTQDVQTGGDPP
ncbi:pentapeptide repeat-containing protein [Nonomuraea sp. NPDC050786]|uniref:pentapeptide repeat-containing protein n=1 Tax=Nonomuraea sp. NPDC050786 TaxID=3154840 RepID=UPI0033E7F48D